MIAEAAGHAADYTKKGTISSYDAYGDSLSYWSSIQKGLYGEDVYGRGGPNTWYEDVEGKIHRNAPLQYIDVNDPSWKTYKPGVTKREDAPLEFWAHEVLEDEYWDLLFKSKELDSIIPANIQQKKNLEVQATIDSLKADLFKKLTYKK